MAKISSRGARLWPLITGSCAGLEPHWTCSCAWLWPNTAGSGALCGSNPAPLPVVGGLNIAQLLLLLGKSGFNAAPLPALCVHNQTMG